ncbi:phosphohexomutase domain-containing protein [Thioalkalivibrio paradoxus]|uniref:phosphomannomutase n=1 Tax=Thioalkalivibrio paradoxus ARh 1 TaxID=713585 RepID=W0DJ07_9GAMM|nr:phosphomannomutase/phosphoglucomutase [Thioalkalivibrio paradoxus]AHE96988.1 phosphomannomutase [Thioalkalivibrio paradoxus ARh 1]
MTDLSCFMPYDIRGRVPDDLDTALARDIGRAFVAEFGARRVVVGHDVRLESPALAAALSEGLTESGADVVDIGLCGTEEVYFGTVHQAADGGIMVTASHNPKGYNGMKLVRAGAVPVSGDSGLLAIRDRIAARDFPPPGPSGRVTVDDDKTPYLQHLLGYIDPALLRPLKIVADPGNGGAGPVVQRLAERLSPLEFVLIHEIPDGNFPNGVPNPLLPERRAATAEAVRLHGADFGIAWDGDFDRCFLFDADGRFIEGYYLVGLLAEVMLKKYPGEKILHDPRLTWNTIEQVQAAGGQPVLTKTGHAFMKERLRREDAVYGGEMSAHHYFRDFAYCDSGMIPWLLIAELISRSGRSLAELVDARMAAFPCSGEINFRVPAVAPVLERVLAHFAPQRPAIDRTDGISVEFPDWRFNLRASNTEPLLRLNVESRGDPDAVERRVQELAHLIESA